MLSLDELLSRLESRHVAFIETWEDKESWLIYVPRYALDLVPTVKGLDESIVWQQDALKIYGKTVDLPRLTAWYGDEGTDYVYSGIKNVPKPWTRDLQKLKDRLAQDLGVAFNAVLLNRYANGEQHMGYHADAEPEFGKNPLIASLSFGETRRFLWKKKKSKDPAEKLELEHGSLLLMGGTFQDEYVHSVPKSKRVSELRLNLTFRLILKAHR